MENPGIKWGIYLGIASIAISLIFYIINPVMMYQFLPGAGTVGLIVSIVLMVLAGKEKRESLGGFASFGQIFPTPFIASVIGSVISLVFGYILVNFVDPGLIDVQKEAAMETSVWMMELMGVSGEAMDEAIAQTEAALEDQDIGGIGQTIKGLIGAVIGGAIFSAIVSLFVKKKNPADF